MVNFDLKFFLVFFVLLGSNFTFFAFGGYSFISLPFVMLYVLKNFYYIRGKLLLFIFIFSFGAILPFIADPFDIIKEMIFLLYFIFGFFISRKIYYCEILFCFILTFLLAIAAVQWLLPQAESFLLIFFSRLYFPVGLRGASSVFQEPSFYSFFCAAIFLMAWAKENFTFISNKIWFLLIANFIASGSFIFVIVLPFMVVALRLPLMAKTFFSIFVIFMFCEYIDFDDIGLRFSHLFVNLLEGNIIEDSSASARLFYIVKDLKQFFSCSILFPTFTAGYHASFDLCGNIVPPENFPYDPALSGSFLGRYLVQFGIFILGFIIWLFWCLPGRVLKKVFALVFFCALFIQMVPITFPIIGVSLGFLMGLTRCRTFHLVRRSKPVSVAQHVAA